MQLSIIFISFINLLHGNQYLKRLSNSFKKACTKCVCISEANYTLSTVRTTNQEIFLYADYVTYVNMLHVNEFFVLFKELTRKLTNWFIQLPCLQIIFTRFN